MWITHVNLPLNSDVLEGWGQVHTNTHTHTDTHKEIKQNTVTHLISDALYFQGCQE